MILEVVSWKLEVGKWKVEVGSGELASFQLFGSALK
jgi:hypothetical protein